MLGICFPPPFGVNRQFNVGGDGWTENITAAARRAFGIAGKAVELANTLSRDALLLDAALRTTHCGDCVAFLIHQSRSGRDPSPRFDIVSVTVLTLSRLSFRHA
jgi:hypothetical protein